MAEYGRSSSSARAVSVLMTTDAVGGVWSYSLTLARELSARGCSVHLVVFGPAPDAAQRAEAESIQNVTLECCAEPLEWMEEAQAEHSLARSVELLQARASSLRPDVLHLNGFAYAAARYPAPVVVVAHSCVLSWWRAVKGEPAPARFDVYRKRVQRGLASADAVLAPSHCMLRCLEQEYAHRGGRVIANGIARPPASVLSKEPFALCAGRVWDEAKNIRTLLEAAVGSDLRVCVAGPGSEELEHVTGLGRLSRVELDRYMQQARVYVLPARYEPFGLSVLEAACRGAALLLSDIQSLRENWSDAALFVKPDDAIALRHVLSTLARSPELCRELGARAEARADRFSSTRQAERYLGLYRSLPEGTKHAHRPVLSFTDQ